VTGPGAPPANAAEPVKIYPCPLPGCRFVMDSEPPGPGESDTTLADIFGFGIFGAIALAHRLERMERLLVAHLNTHTVQEFAIALAAAQTRIAELTGGSQDDVGQVAHA
jgi:hypothetical protein